MKIAVVIGHSELSPGAYNEKYKIYEFDFNEKLSHILAKELIQKGYDVDVVYRDVAYSKLPEKINNLKPDFILSLHCNAFNKKATGTETLFYYRSNTSKKAAEIFQSNIVSALKLRDRGVQGLTVEDRGGFLLKHTIASCVIIEPFFIDNDQDYLLALSKYMDLVTALVNSIDGLIGII